jgi:hypothetical protein
LFSRQHKAYPNPFVSATPVSSFAFRPICRVKVQLNMNDRPERELAILQCFEVGDNVTAKYYAGFGAELRKPTPGEEKEPLVVLDPENLTKMHIGDTIVVTLTEAAVVSLERASDQPKQYGND